MYRPIDPTVFDAPRNRDDLNPGPVPSLLWLRIADLVVDSSYQREIGRRGSANIKAIAANFEWSKFAPVIVAAIEGGRYAIVDGQHRTTAAALCGFESVPCQIIQADRMRQAQAFAAVNGSITHTSPQQLFHAKVAAQDPRTIELNQVLLAAGVFVTKGHRTAATYQVGETQAIGALTRCLRKYGRDTLITALQCITQTADGNAGFVRATIVETLCAVLNQRHNWRDAGGALLRAMDDFDFLEEWDRLAEGKNVVLSKVVSKELSERLFSHIEARLKTSVRASYVDRKSEKSNEPRAA